MNETESTINRALILRIIVKALALFMLLNLLFALFQPLPLIGKLSVYNWLVPGRTRLPYGENPQAYNLSLDNLEAMFASHEIVQPKAANEYRIVFIGDSSTWGILLKPDETLTANINVADLTLDSGQQIRAYNLGHPILALSKDFLILDHALAYEPDMIVWLTTLRSFPRNKQFFPPLVQNNSPAIHRLFKQYQLDYDLSDPQLADPTFLEQTIIGQRRPLADWLRLQLYGFVWAATGIDQFYPDTYDLRSSDFEVDISWDDYTEPQTLTGDDLAFDIIAAAQERSGRIPVLLVNEPIFISDGENSHLRYNFWYPRWAYDNYRDTFAQMADTNKWHYVDLWDRIAGSEFTDSPVHLTPEGTSQLADILSEAILTLANDEADE
ncbi:MAG: hypothetical protein CL610_09085 [Anaerolineaceae bacterium]|nr:hypothetical protein [Anaerolineaceae bacterium]